MHSPEFDAYISEARVRPEIWRLLLGVLLIIFIYAGWTALVFAMVGGVLASTEGPFAILPFFTGLAEPDTPVEVLVLLATFGGMFLGPILAAAALHFRGPGSLFGLFGDWMRGFFLAICVIGAVFSGFLTLAFIYGAPMPNIDFSLWLKLLPLSVGLLFVQITAEELVFRGYLQQQLAARFRSRLVWMWLPSVLFAMLHYDPTLGPNLPLVLFATLVFAVIAADLTEVSGNLGAAMGLHFANNFFGILVYGTQGSITGLALFVSESSMSDTGLQSWLILGSSGVMIAIGLFLRRLLKHY